MDKYKTSKTKLKSKWHIARVDERTFYIGCENCKTVFFFFLEENETRKALPLYCSNCGARMKTLKDGEVRFII